MSRERSNDHTSSAESLLRDTSASTDIVNNGYMNPVGPDNTPSSPPPSYQHVLEETRLAALCEERPSCPKPRPRPTKQSSFESSQESIPNRASSNNTLSSDDSINSPPTNQSRQNGSDESAKDAKQKKADKKKGLTRERTLTNGSDLDGSSCGGGSAGEASTVRAHSWNTDRQEPSTSYDASSRQFDESSLATLAMSQFGDYEDGEDELTGLARGDYSDDADDELYESVGRRNHRNDNYTNNCRLQERPSQQDDIIKVVANKTSKEMYLAMARELGIVCRMSDQCRCLDCQGGYLECSGESGEACDENAQTDGGLGAGTPMFVSEAFGHGMAPACTIL